MRTQQQRVKRKKNEATYDWIRTVENYRNESMRVVREIRQGMIQEEDMDKLQNFILFSCALMEMEGPQKWALAKVQAELLSIRMGGTYASAEETAA